jgi:hypothetical protein
MKDLLNSRLLATALILALFTGCAGITEANLDDADTADAATIEQPVQSVEAPDYFHSGDQEDIIEERPSRTYEERK